MIIHTYSIDDLQAYPFSIFNVKHSIHFDEEVLLRCMSQQMQWPSLWNTAEWSASQDIQVEHTMSLKWVVGIHDIDGVPLTTQIHQVRNYAFVHIE